MRILVLGLDSPLGYALRSFATRLMRHEIVGVDMDTTRWRRERQVKKLIRREPIDLILDARLVTQIDGVDPVGQPDVERTRWLAELAARDRVSYLFLSSARVFSGTLTRPYRESDQPDATDAVGKTLIEVEELLKASLEEVFILRLGLMFGGRRPNPLARALDALARGDRIRVSEQARGSPVHVAEVARVIHGDYRSDGCWLAALGPLSLQRHWRGQPLLLYGDGIGERLSIPALYRGPRAHGVDRRSGGVSHKPESGLCRDPASVWYTAVELAGICSSRGSALH